VQIVVSSPAVVARANDIVLTYEFLRGHGFDAPLTCLPGRSRWGRRSRSRVSDALPHLIPTG
jgi:hypothetical protein